MAGKNLELFMVIQKYQNVIPKVVVYNSTEVEGRYFVTASHPFFGKHYIWKVSMLFSVEDDCGTEDFLWDEELGKPASRK